MIYTLTPTISSVSGFPCLPGVSQVNVFGSPLAIRIQVDPGKLVANDISLAELATAIALGNVNFPTGQLDGPIEAPNVSVDGQLVTAAEWDPLIVAYRNGTPLRIKDLGQTSKASKMIKSMWNMSTRISRNRPSSSPYKKSRTPIRSPSPIPSTISWQPSRTSCPRRWN